MGRPTNKGDLIEDSNMKFNKMFSLIDSMSEDALVARFSFGEEKGKEAHWGRDRNLRDVLIHVLEWQYLLIDWVRTNQRGVLKSFLPAPYNWRTYGDLNLEIWKKHQETSVHEAMLMLRESHNQVLEIIEEFSDDDLFKKGSLSWTKTSTLGSYCVSALASHYDWAMKKIKLHNKTYTGES